MTTKQTVYINGYGLERLPFNRQYSHSKNMKILILKYICALDI